MASTANNTVTDAAGNQTTPFTREQVAAAYKAIYGSVPAGMANPKTGQLASQYKDIYPYTVLKSPTGQDIDINQLMYMYRQSPAGQQAAAGTPGAGQAGQAGSSGGPSNSYLNVTQSTASAPTTQGPPAMATGDQDAFGIRQVGGGPGYTILRNTKGQQLAVDNAGNYFNIDPATGNHLPVTDLQAVSMGFKSANPETNAQQQIGQIDPASEALRTAVAGSYLTPLQQAGQNLNKQPTAADYQSYLDLFKQVDPEEYAQRQGLATSMDSYLKQAQAEAALGSQLDPVTARQVQQQTRAGQAARGNVYGTPQMVQEAMTTGQAGEARKQQRQAALGSALGAQQSYLGAGLGLGDTAMNLYQQGLSNQQQRMAQLQSLQGGALSYLGSGQTPYQVGASYLDRANMNASQSAQGGPVYNPTALGQSYTGTAQQAPQYGLDIGAQTQNWYNSLAAYGGGGAPTKNKGVSAATGALSGGVSGATAGSALGPYGTIIGGVVGAAAGGLGGYYS